MVKIIEFSHGPVAYLDKQINAGLRGPGYSIGGKPMDGFRLTDGTWWIIETSSASRMVSGPYDTPEAVYLALQMMRD